MPAYGYYVTVKAFFNSPCHRLPINRHRVVGEVPRALLEVVQSVLLELVLRLELEVLIETSFAVRPEVTPLIEVRHPSPHRLNVFPEMTRLLKQARRIILHPSSIVMMAFRAHRDTPKPLL